MLGISGLCFIVQQQRTASAGGHSLVAIETENANPPKCPGVAALLERTQRFCRVLDDRQSPPAAKFHQRVHIDGVAKRMHRNDGADSRPREAVSRLPLSLSAISFR